MNKKKENALKLLALSQLNKKGPKASKLQLLEAHKGRFIYFSFMCD